MSVVVHKRQTSVVQFIDTARELFSHTIIQARKFPKSYMFLITKDVVDGARSVYKNVLKANSLRPKTALDVEIRYKYLIDAKAELHALSGLLGELKELFTIKLSDYAWKTWGELIDKETSLIVAVINSDKKGCKL